eukprot:217291_1
MTSSLHDTQSIVDKSQNVEDLLSIMKQISFKNLKQFVHNELNKTNQSLSIHDIIPDAVLQYTLNYIPYQESTKYVNKTFYNLFRNNNNSRMYQRKKYISSKFKNTNLYFVNSEQINNGIKVPLISLDDAINIVESGDKIILSDGKYFPKNSLGCDGKDIQIEGNGKTVLFLQDIQLRSQTFALSNVTVSGSFNAIDCDIWMTNCSLESYPSIRMKGGTLNCEQCEFISNGYTPTAIHASSSSKLCIIDCRFITCGDDVDNIIQTDDENPIVWTVIGNRFERLFPDPIGVKPNIQDAKLEVSDDAVFQDNMHVIYKQYTPDWLNSVKFVSHSLI